MAVFAQFLSKNNQIVHFERFDFAEAPEGYFWRLTFANWLDTL